ncbi:MAG TPA: hypothetical protein VFQ88_02115 [Nevskiaceae bacterium]|nr:hypothetical protein [Nevskiaceae bacterium]
MTATKNSTVVVGLRCDREMLASIDTMPGSTRADKLRRMVRGHSAGAEIAAETAKAVAREMAPMGAQLAALSTQLAGQNAAAAGLEKKIERYTAGAVAAVAREDQTAAEIRSLIEQKLALLDKGLMNAFGKILAAVRSRQ